MLDAFPVDRLILPLSIALVLGAVSCRTGSQDTERAEARADALAIGPKVRIDHPRHDFGRVTEGDKLRHVFTVTNDGDAPLVIEKVTTSCGCTAAVVKEKTVPPGGQTEVKVEVDTNNRPGSQHKTASVFTNDPATPQSRLDIQAEVIPQLAFEPRFARLVGKKGEKTSLDVWLTGTLAPTAKPKLDDTKGNDAVSATIIEESTGDGKRQGVRLVSKNAKVGRGRGVIQISTSVEPKPVLQLRYSYETTGNISAPQQVYLDPSRENLRERVFPVKSPEKNFVLRNARVAEGPFTAVVSKTDDGYEVKVTAQPPPNQKGIVRGKLVLVSNDPLEPSKEVQLTLGQPRRRIEPPHPPTPGATAR